MAGVAERELCGIICVNKPEGFTSFDVIAKMRGILKMKRLGHGGTLDPMATGVLPVFAGKATKACDILPDSDKAYRAGFRLGVSTDTQDCTGRTVSERGADGVTREDVSAALKNFRGNIMQIPPMYSAVSVGGRRLYDLARQGIEVEREPRAVTVYSLELAEYNDIEKSGVLEISCSKGTYIRTVIADMGDILGCGGIMTSLVRTRACGFCLEECVTLERLQEAAESGDFSPFVRPVEQVFDYLPRLRLNSAMERLYRSGVKLSLDRLRFDRSAERVAVYGEKGFIGTAVPDVREGVLRVDKNFY